MSAPCSLCGVRPDVACRHRPADPNYAPPVQDRDYDAERRQRSDNLQGLNFKRRMVKTTGGHRFFKGVPNG